MRVVSITVVVILVVMKSAIISCAKHFIGIIPLPSQTLLGGKFKKKKVEWGGKYIITPILQMWKARLREVKSLGPSHIARADQARTRQQSVISGQKGENQGNESV